MERKRPRQTHMPPKARSTRNGRPGSASGPGDVSAGLSVIRVDGARIRQKIKREYEKVRRELEKAQEELDRFQQKDMPAYNQWVNRHFGPALAELRETTRRVRELEQLFLEIQTEILFKGSSEAEAYADIMERRNNPEPPPEDEEDEDPFSQHANEHARRGSGPEFAESSGPTNNRPQPGPRSTARLKELYRALARLLHPDAQKEMTPQKREWWHEAQAAYEAGDVEQLEQILSLCEIADAGTTGKATLSMLQRLSAQLKRSLRHLKRQLTVSRRDPAWNFTNRTDLPQLNASIRRELNHDLRLMQEQLKAMELEVAALADRSQRRRAPRRRSRRRPLNEQDIFDLFF